VGGARRSTMAGLEGQISRLVRKPATARNTDQLSKLTKALDRLRRSMPKPKARPTVRAAVHTELLARALDPSYGLYTYQAEFLASEDRFRSVLKSRQIGFSFVIALAAVLGAAAGRDQLVVSASEDQAHIILAYAEQHAERLGLAIDPEGNTITLGGATIRALSTNFRTVQGHAGDVWFDEFAWLRQKHQRQLWGALVPSITAVGGRVTITSTPFLPGTLHWEIAENHQGRWSQFQRWRITIHDAIAQGMPLPGGLDELRGLFDADTWAMFYLCQYAEGTDSLLSWSLLHELTVPDITALRTGRLRGGVDIGRTGHRFAVAMLGQVQDSAGAYSDRFALTHHLLRKGLTFAAQRQEVLHLDRLHQVERWSIDRTGLGMQIAEELARDLAPRVFGVHFDAGKKQRMALNLLKLAEDKRLVLPNDPDALASLHDLFWALAMAADGRARDPHGTGGAKVEVWT